MARRCARTEPRHTHIGHVNLRWFLEIVLLREPEMSLSPSMGLLRVRVRWWTLSVPCTKASPANG